VRLGLNLAVLRPARSYASGGTRVGSLTGMNEHTPNNRMQRTALRAAADDERWASLLIERRTL